MLYSDDNKFSNTLVSWLIHVLLYRTVSRGPNSLLIRSYNGMIRVVLKAQAGDKIIYPKKIRSYEMLKLMAGYCEELFLFKKSVSNASKTEFICHFLLFHVLPVTPLAFLPLRLKHFDCLLPITRTGSSWRHSVAPGSSWRHSLPLPNFIFTNPEGRRPEVRAPGSQ